MRGRELDRLSDMHKAQRQRVLPLPSRPRTAEFAPVVTRVGWFLIALVLFSLSIGALPSATASERVARSVDENAPVGTVVGSPVVLANPVGSVNYSLKGQDAASFSIDAATGQLRTNVELDYETRRSYQATVQATDSNGSTKIAVTVTVRDLDEPAVIGVTPEPIRAGTVLRGFLTDPDGGVVPDAVLWDWSVSTDGIRFRTVKSGIPGHVRANGSDRASLDLHSTHVGKYLRVSVKYADRHSRTSLSFDKTAEWVSAERIGTAETRPQLSVRPLVSDLSIPWDVAFTPDGTMLITERGGGLWSRRPDGRMQRITADMSDIVLSWEIGLMSLAVDPDFAANRRFYTCQGHTGPQVQVIAWTIDESFSTATRVNDPLVGGIAVARQIRHGGCRIRIGPDGYLWITTGDGVIVNAAQDTDSLAGKVLRVDRKTGAGASDNPFKNRVYSYGHRNPQGLAFRPGTSQVWLVEHGPNHDDEINLLQSGGNYGWQPGLHYDQDVPMTNLGAFPGAIEAKWRSGYPTIATSGAVFLEGEGWGEWNGRLAVAALKFQQLRVFEFAGDGTLISEILAPELDQKYGRLRSPVLGPNGALYVTTSNARGGNRADHVLQVFGPSTPRLNGPDAVTYAEGRTVPAATFTAQHLSAPLTWSVGGADAGAFSINAGGELSFSAAPQTGTPADADKNNVYHLFVKATDGADSAEQAVQVTVTSSTPEVSISANGDVTEGGAVSFTLTADPAPATALQVAVTLSASGDYGISVGQRTVTIQSAGSATLTIPTADDNIDEADGWVTATLQDGTSYTVSSTNGAATVAVADNDVPELSIASGGTITEGGTAGFTITASPVPTSPLTVNVGVAESGDFGASGAATVTVSGATSTYTITTTDDNTDEADGTVTATLQDGSGYTVSSSSGVASVNVVDNDDPPVVTPELSISAGGGITEGGTASFTITANPAPSSPITVSIGVSESGDFGATGAATVTVSGASSTYTVTTTDDDVDEPDGSVKAALKDGDGYTVSSANGAATVTVADNDDSYTVDPDLIAKVKALAAQSQHGPDHVNRWSRVLVAFGVLDGEGVTGGAMTADEAQDMADKHSSPVWDEVVTELTALEAWQASQSQDEQITPTPELSIAAGSGITEGGTATFTITANPAPTSPITVKVGVSESGDFGAGGAATVTVSGASTTYTVTTTDDEADEADGSVTATLQDATGYTVSSANGAATVSVADNDDPAPTEYTVDPAVVDKVKALAAQTQHGTVHVNRWNRVLVAFGEHDGTGVTDGAMTADEAQDMADKHSSPVWGEVVTELTALEAWQASQNQDEQITPTPVLSISAGTAITEGGTASFTITANPAPASPITVKVGVSESGSFGASGAATVAVSGVSTTYTVTTTDDNVDEPDGSVTATLQDGSGYTVSSSGGAATVSVADNDDAPVITPVVSISAGGGITEGGTASFTITASPAPSSPITVKLGVSESGSFGASGAATVTVSGASTTYTVSTTDDNVDEPNGSVTATLQDGSGYTVSSSGGAATVSVADNDVPELSIAAGSGITEGGSATFTITANPAPASPITVKVGVSQSGAFGASGAATVTVSGASTTYTISTTDDNTDEADGSVTATLQDGSGYTVSSTNGAATVSVADNDDAAPEVEITITVEEASASEDDEYLEFTVRLSQTSTEEITVRWNTATAWDVVDNRAHGGSDYEEIFGDELVFAAGVTELTDRVSLYEDGKAEGDERFEVQVFLPGNYWPADATGIMTIIDAD